MLILSPRGLDETMVYILYTFLHTLIHIWFSALMMQLKLFPCPVSLYIVLPYELILPVTYLYSQHLPIPPLDLALNAG